MPVTLPLEVYEVFEKVVGKEDARVLVKSFEATISEVTDYKWKVTKDELLEAIRKEWVCPTYPTEARGRPGGPLAGEEVKAGSRSSDLGPSIASGSTAPTRMGG